MGQPGGELAQRQQLLAIVDEPTGALGADGDPVEQVHRHRELVFHEGGEGRCVHHEEPRRLGDVHRGGVGLLLLAGKRLPRTAIHAAMRCPVGFDVLAAGQLRHGQLAIDQDVETRCRLTLDTQRAGFEVLDVPVGAQRRELLVVEALEEEQGAQLGGLTRVFGGHDSAR